MKKQSKKQKQLIQKKERMFNQQWNIYQAQNPYNPLTDKHTIYYRDASTFYDTPFNTHKQKQISSIKNNIGLISQLKNNKSPHQLTSRRLSSQYYSSTKDPQKSISSFGSSTVKNKKNLPSVQNSKTILPSIDSTGNISFSKRKKKNRSKVRSLSKKLIMDLDF